jgi:hypothetical protein
MSEALLRNPSLKLIMVDSWKPESGHTKSYRDSGDWHAHQSEEEQTAHETVAREVTEFAGTRREIMKMDSIDAAKHVLDHSLDFVFIDADHSFSGCSSDISSWRSKVKPGGLLCGHDYGFETLPGVKKAVDEFVTHNGLKLELGENYTWFVRL